jgi:dipeptidyl aminopeptidase/acylaminoacyl peptidase
MSATYSPTEPQLLVSGDIGGNEQQQLYLLNADGSSFTALTDKPSVMYLPAGWSLDGKRILYSSNERDARYYDVYEREISSGDVRLLLQSDHTNYAARYSPDGTQALVVRMEAFTRTQLFLIDIASGDVRALTPPITEEHGQYSQAQWTADGKGLYVLSDRGREFLSLACLDLATGELSYLNNLSWDSEMLALTHDSTSMALVINEDGYARLELYDVAQGWQQRRELPVPALPEGVIYSLTWSEDNRRLAIILVSPDDSYDVWVWEVPTQTIKRVTRSAMGGIPRSTFVKPELIHYPSFDGRQIPAFLFLPQGQRRDLPIVIDVHGGPEGQRRVEFSAVTQYLVSRGYGVLATNVRGSTGYGYEYQSLDDVRKRMDSVADLQYAALWLRESGIGDPTRIAVMGGSYGGFMVLSAITTYPDLWAAAVDIVGIANFVTFLENTGPWRRKLREAEYGSLENDREFLEQISPIHHVDKITAPLFVVHGANDPRVPVGEAEQVAGALRSRGVPVEYLRFEDEGHGLVKRANKLVAYPAIARFLDQHLGK